MRKDFIGRLDPLQQVSRVAQQIWAQSKFQKSEPRNSGVEDALRGLDLLLF